MNPQQVSHSQLLMLKRWNTPTIYNGWEMITRHDVAVEGFNLATRERFGRSGEW